MTPAPLLTLWDLNASLARHRRVIFCTEDDGEIEKARAEIRRLLALLDQHPDEIKRRAQVRANAAQRFLFRTR